MKVLLDENMPHDFRHFLPGHEVYSMAYLEWHGLTNGEMLKRAASSGFDVIITMDAGIRYEQNLTDLPVAVMVIRAPSNALDDLRPIVPTVLRGLETLRPRSTVVIGET